MPEHGPIVIEQFELLLSRLQASLHHTEDELKRHVADSGKIAREALALHAALAEAIRRLKAADAEYADLMQALDTPATAPLTWGRASKTQQELSDQYERIYGEGAYRLVPDSLQRELPRHD